MQSKQSHTAQAWLVTLTASLFFFYSFIQLNLFSAINTSLMQAFNLDASQLGQLASMYFYGNALFLFPAGLLLDRVSPKKLLLMAIFLTAVGTFAFGSATNYLTAAVARFVVGIGASFCFLSCIRIASRWFSPSRMAFVTGIIVTMAMLGGMVAQTPMTLLSEALGVRQAILLDAGLGVVIFLAAWMFVADRPAASLATAKDDHARLKAMGIWRSISFAISNPQNWLGGIYAALLNLPVFLLGALWGIHYLTEVHHISAVEASYATTLFFVGVILGSPAYGWFSDYIGLRRMPMIIGAILSLIVVLILMYVPNLSLGALITLFFLIGFTTSSQVLAYPVIAELNPSAITSTAVSIASVTLMSSGFIFQPLFGWMMELKWDHKIVEGLPVYSAADFNNAMWIMPIGFIVGLIISFFIKETYCQSKEFQAHSSSACSHQGGLSQEECVKANPSFS